MAAEKVVTKKKKGITLNIGGSLLQRKRRGHQNSLDLEIDVKILNPLAVSNEDP
jgi:hypothetical protein